jgi:hypothetical protein
LSHQLHFSLLQKLTVPEGESFAWFRII